MEKRKEQLQAEAEGGQEMGRLTGTTTQCKAQKRNSKEHRCSYLGRELKTDSHEKNKGQALLSHPISAPAIFRGTTP